MVREPIAGSCAHLPWRSLSSPRQRCGASAMATRLSLELRVLGAAPMPRRGGFGIEVRLRARCSERWATQDPTMSSAANWKPAVFPSESESRASSGRSARASAAVLREAPWCSGVASGGGTSDLTTPFRAVAKSEVFCTQDEGDRSNNQKITDPGDPGSAARRPSRSVTNTPLHPRAPL
jgi:hypothetical protein